MVEISKCPNSMHDAAQHFIVQILTKEFSLANIPRPDIEHISDIYQNGDGGFWIAVDEEKIVGTLALQDYGKGRLRMRRFMVANEWRGKGLAQQMLAVCIGHAESGKAEGIYLSTVPELARANRFYEKMGFSRIEQPNWFPETEDTIFFMLEVTSSSDTHRDS